MMSPLTLPAGPDYNFAIRLKIPHQIPVQSKVGMREDVAFDDCPFDNPVGLA
jgi:hypothetical protein